MLRGITRGAAALALATVGALAPWTATAGAAARAPLTIEVRSNQRADLVSDGDALVAIRARRTADLGRVTVRLGRRDVTRVFRVREDGTLQGLVEGLRVGRSVLRATLPNGRGARLVITNHPNGGPIFSGPQNQPFRCQETAVDAQCNQPPEYELLYKSTDPTSTGLEPYDPDDPPSDVATTTTDEGVTVPFIVRQETGYQDRDEYKILTLFDPAQPWTRWEPQRQWNHKVLIPHGGNCGGDYETDHAPLNDFSGTIPELPLIPQSYVAGLGRGFAVMSAALANTGHNCSVPLGAEALIMLKERLIEQYGDVRYTIGTGCSGGSIAQQTIANAYPGAVYDGLIITCAYPDSLTAGAQFADYHLMRLYFEGSPGAFWLPVQWGFVEGRPDPVNAITADELLFKAALDPDDGCVPAEHLYNAETNPGGTRCSVLDWMINVLGPRGRDVWTEQERRAGKGFAGVPFGNVGIRYGLETLRSGLITADQFVDLNERIGGLDIDMAPAAERVPGDDAAIANAYRSGSINEMNNLEGVAIIHHAGPDSGIAHDYAHSWWIRDRLERAQGHHGNHVLWYGPAPLVGDLRWPVEALDALDRWLTAFEADTSARSRAQKILDNKPADLDDRCLLDICKQYVATRYGTPRSVAGGDNFNDIVKCRLKPNRREDYPVAFTDAQWETLQRVFAEGVCDWNQPGVGQQDTIPWLTYADRRGRVIYGGRPMRPAPRSTPVRGRR